VNASRDLQERSPEKERALDDAKWLAGTKFSKLRLDEMVAALLTDDGGLLTEDEVREIASKVCAERDDRAQKAQARMLETEAQRLAASGMARDDIHSVLAALNAHSPTPLNDTQLHTVVTRCTVILVREGELTSIVDTVRVPLVRRNIFERGEHLVRPVTFSTVRKLLAPDKTKVERADDAIVLVPVGEVWLREEMGKVRAWGKLDKTKGGTVVRYIDPPLVYATTLLARKDGAFRHLRGIVSAPTLSRDGRIIETPGYDDDSQLWLNFPVGLYPPIPPRPTLDDARRALDELQQPLRKFPFVAGVDRSVALAGLLTSVIRASLRTAPLFAVTAPAAGTGKTLLAELIGALPTGNTPASITQASKEEEDEKRLSTLLGAGDSIILIDNCKRPLQGDFLCTMLTAEMVQARILGVSERRLLPCTAMVLATGNNLGVKGDLTRRVVMCHLDAKMEQPDARSFDFNCLTELLANRPRLVIAALTIMRAYHVAGRPKTHLAPMGSFEDWDWVRGALVWLGRDDPADTRVALFANDEHKEDLREVMDAWQAAFGAGAVKVEVLTPPPPGVEEDDAIVALRQRLIDATSGEEWNARMVGHWLSRHKDRRVGARHFHFCGKRRWQLCDETPAGQEPAVEADDGM